MLDLAQTRAVEIERLSAALADLHAASEARADRQGQRCKLVTDALVRALDAHPASRSKDEALQMLTEHREDDHPEERERP